MSGVLASVFTSIRGGALNILSFVSLPIRWTLLTTAHMRIGYIVVDSVA
jgi:hypothetical protein